MGCLWVQRPIKKWVSSMPKKDKMVDGAPRKLCVSHPHFMGLILARRGRSSGEQTWKLIWNEHKIIAWSYWPYIYTEWLSKYSIWWCSWPAWQLQNNPSMGKVWFKNIWSRSKPKDTYCLKLLSQWKSLTCWWKQQQLVVVLFFNIWAEISY